MDEEGDGRRARHLDIRLGRVDRLGEHRFESGMEFDVHGGMTSGTGGLRINAAR
jgi:hypothetical protein